MCILCLRAISTEDLGFMRAALKPAEPDRVYTILRTSILRCRFRPGDFLPEAELATKCKSSRTPVREACNRLAQEGWIRKIPHRGYLVKPISLQEIVEVYEYRRLLECHTAGLAARTASKDQLSHLTRTISMENGNLRSQMLITANTRFHLGIAEIAGNLRILNALELMLEYVHRLDILSTQRESSWIPHRKILTALKMHDCARATKAMAVHIDEARDRMLRIFAP